MSHVLTRTAPRTILVWDRFVRVFHWGLVAAVTVCFWSGFAAPREWLNLHLAAGTAVAALVCFRLIWGALGSTYARFGSFWPSLPAIRAHVSRIARGRPQRHLGHNPLGAVMIFALLCVLALLTVTGVVALGGALKQGPLAAMASFSAGWTARGVHEMLAWALLAMIAGHLAGVVFESFLSGENIARAMLTGRKRAPLVTPGMPAPGRPIAAWSLFAATAAIVALGTILLSQRPANGVPRAPLDPVYAKECGSCHLAYPPSLGAAMMWASVMAGLDNHFGETASLDPDTMAKLLAYLTINSAEHFDTLAANRFRTMNKDDPGRITATPGWVRMHRDIPASVFAAESVGAKGACQACHRDAASGRFDPQLISIPEGARS